MKTHVVASAVLAALSCAANASVVFENARMKLVVGDDGEAARMKMLSVLNDERANLKELREFANEAERAEIAKKLAEILASDKRLCGR